MVKIIEDEKQICKLQDQFHNLLKKHFSTIINCSVGFPNGSIKDVNVHYSPLYNLWCYIGKHNNKIWNGFGLEKPKPEKSNSLVLQIDFPKEGINRHFAGVFGIDKEKIFVLHRGIIGGGRPGICKKKFLKETKSEHVLTKDGNRETYLLKVAELQLQEFPDQLANFIKEVDRVKNLLKTKI